MPEAAGPRVTVEAIEALCQYGAPPEEIAAYLGLTPEELQATPDVVAAFERGEAKRRLLLRQARMKKALAGDEAALKQASQPAAAELIEAERARRLAEFLIQRAR